MAAGRSSTTFTSVPMISTNGIRISALIVMLCGLDTIYALVCRDVPESLIYLQWGQRSHFCLRIFRAGILVSLIFATSKNRSFRLT